MGERVRWTNSLARYDEYRPKARVAGATVTIVRSLYGWQWIVETRAATCSANGYHTTERGAKCAAVAMARRLRGRRAC